MENEMDFLEDLRLAAECRVCYEPLGGTERWPMFLCCGHVVCLSCLNKIAVEVEDGKKVAECPVCRIVTRTPVEFPPAYQLAEICEAINNYVALVNKRYCTSCSAEVKNVVFCETCWESGKKEKEVNDGTGDPDMKKRKIEKSGSIEMEDQPGTSKTDDVGVNKLKLADDGKVYRPLTKGPFERPKKPKSVTVIDLTRTEK